MTFWIVVAAVVVLGFAFAWWHGGRAKPDLSRRSLRHEIAIRKGRDEGRNTSQGGGGSFGVGGSGGF